LIAVALMYGEVLLWVKNLAFLVAW
jgi:hypothetical protein